MRKLLFSVALVVSGLHGGVASAGDAEAKLDQVLAAQSDEMKARYTYRNPKETLMFFGVKPGMKVADFLPGKDWYAGIMLPYLGEEGTYVGADLTMEAWDDYKRFTDDPEGFMKGREGWPDRFRERAEGWRSAGDAQIGAFRADAVPAEIEGTLDVVLAIRAFHLPTRVDGAATRMAAGIFKALKPGGVLGVVQHRAAESKTDEWARGYNGYVKQSALIREIEAAGFVLEATSEVNANPKDQPTDSDQVWRLPPSLGTSEEGSPERAAVLAIGESDRMTLKFRKPE
jgi:predicted methyltransferase